MKRKPTANPSSLFLLELIFAILFFSVASAVCVQIFVKSHTLSTQAHDLTQASRRAGDVAELITASTSPDDMKNLLEDAYSGASSDTELFKNHRSTICFQGHRIATCLYRTPMGSRV